MGLHIDVWSDFVCPWCYLVSTSLERLHESHAVSIAWKSYELRSKGSPPIPEAYKARIKSLEPQLKAMAKSHYGIEINQGKFGIDSRPALIGEKFAEQFELSNVYHKAVFEAYWLEAKNIEDSEVLGEIAQGIGLNPDDFLASLNNPELDTLVDKDIQQARELEIRGVPALIFEEKYYIPGAQPYEELVRFVEQLERRLEHNI